MNRHNLSQESVNLAKQELQQMLHHISSKYQIHMILLRKHAKAKKEINTFLQRHAQLFVQRSSW